VLTRAREGSPSLPEPPARLSPVCRGAAGGRGPRDSGDCCGVTGSSLLYTQQQHCTGTVWAERLSLVLGKSSACREGMFCRSRSILPRYQNSHLFGRSRHARMSRTGMLGRFSPCGVQRQKAPHATTTHPASPRTLAGR